MKRLVLLAVALFSLYTVRAQRADSLFVAPHDHGWAIKHPVKAGETVFSIARRYHVPPAILADVNKLNYQSSLAVGDKVLVPLGAYNQRTSQPPFGEYRPIYRRVSGDDDLRSIARASMVSQRSLQNWNGLIDNEIERGDILKVGWVMYDNTNIQPTTTKPAPVTTPIATVPQPPRQPMVVSAPKPSTSSVFKPQKRDTVIQIINAAKDTLEAVADEASLAEEEYLSQTANGQLIQTEKGPVSFYGSKTGSNSFFYGFHNTAPKGTMIKVRNPGTGKTIYVKVLGPMPATRLYHNSVLGINSRARAALGATTEKAWCELTYGR